MADDLNTPKKNKPKSKEEPVELEELQANITGGAVSPQLDLIMDIPVSVSLQVGSAKVSIRNLLALNQGSIIELDRLAGEPLDVVVNGTIVAHGEVVVINDKFGIRLTDILNSTERAINLN